jgi:hypothetical protein
MAKRPSIYRGMDLTLKILITFQNKTDLVRPIAFRPVPVKPNQEPHYQYMNCKVQIFTAGTGSAR